MEMIYAGMLLNSVGKEINEANVKKVLQAAGAEADDTKIKALVSALEGVNIEEAIKAASVAQVAIAPTGTAQAAEKKEEKKEEKKSEEEAAAGLGALFG
ncbi:50S ribosomal protein P1 [Candidatus Woesearchaeota archaeon]|nr:50S ribosomal protein P1 [Candidatus Woesearchaeota archaeon]